MLDFTFSIEAFSILFSALSSACLVYLLSKQSKMLAILDQPNERSLHSTPVHRTGGLGILGGIILGTTILLIYGVANPYVMPISAGVVIIAMISFVDDKQGVSVALRLFFQSLAALLLIIMGLSIDTLMLPGLSLALPVWLTHLFSYLLILWCINLYNFMDGMDGFAGGMAAFGFGTFSLLGWFHGAYEFSVLSGIITASCVGFILFNFPPARIFMGDTGSSVLGFLMAAFMIWADKTGVFPLWVGVLVFSPFIFDATYTLLRRLLAGEKIWEAHRSHLYQRLVLSGWGHKRTLLLEYGVMTACAGFALMAVILDSKMVQVGIIFVSILMYFSFFRYVIKIS